MIYDPCNKEKMVVWTGHVRKLGSIYVSLRIKMKGATKHKLLFIIIIKHVQDSTVVLRT